MGWPLRSHDRTGAPTSALPGQEQEGLQQFQFCVVLVDPETSFLACRETKKKAKMPILNVAADIAIIGDAKQELRRK